MSSIATVWKSRPVNTASALRRIALRKPAVGGRPRCGGRVGSGAADIGGIYKTDWSVRNCQQGDSQLTSIALVSRAEKWLIAVSVMLGTILEVLDTSIVNVALPHMQGAFSASIDEITWVLTSYLIANGIVIPMTGWLSSRFGRKRYFITSVALFTIASMFCGAAPDLRAMVVFRLLQGLAGAAMLPSSQAILMETFPPSEQPIAMATWGVGLMVAPVIGPTLGGWITDTYSWRWCFYINLPFGVIAALMCARFLREPAYVAAQRRRPDWLGIALLVLGLGTLQLVLDRGERADWFDA